MSRRSFLFAAAGLSLAGAGALVYPQLDALEGPVDSELTDDPAIPTPELPSTPAIDPQLITARYAGVPPHNWGLKMPGITDTLPSNARSIALTFDACGGPKGSLVDATLIATLIEFQVPATLFLNKRWIDANPQTARELAAQPLFQIENHGTSHLPLSVSGRTAYGIAGTNSAKEVVEEIQGNRNHLKDVLGVESTWFRAGTAHYDDVSVQIAHDLGVGIAGFDVNGDAGATLNSSAVNRNLSTSGPGTIAIMHMNQPNSGTAAGVRAAIPQLKAAGFTFSNLGAAQL